MKPLEELHKDALDLRDKAREAGNEDEASELNQVLCITGSPEWVPKAEVDEVTKEMNERIAYVLMGRKHPKRVYLKDINNLTKQ